MTEQERWARVGQALEERARRGGARWWQAVSPCVRVLLAVCAAMTLLWLWQGL